MKIRISVSFRSVLFYIILIIAASSLPVALFLKYCGVGYICRNIGSLAYIKMAEAFVDYGFLGYRYDRLIDFVNYVIAYSLFGSKFLDFFSYATVIESITYVTGLVLLSRRLFSSKLLMIVFVLSASWFVYWDAQVVYEAFQTNTLLTVLFVYLVNLLICDQFAKRINRLDKVTITLLSMPIVDRLLLIYTVAKLIPSFSYVAINLMRPLFHAIIMFVLWLKYKQESLLPVVLYAILFMGLLLSDLVGIFLTVWTLITIFSQKSRILKNFILIICVFAYPILCAILVGILTMPDVNLITTLYGIAPTPEIMFQNRVESLIGSSSVFVLIVSVSGATYAAVMNRRDRKHFTMAVGLPLLLIGYFSPEGWLYRLRIFLSPFLGYGFASLGGALTKRLVPKSKAQFLVLLILLMVIPIFFVPPLINKFNPNNLCGYTRYTFYEDELYPLAAWVKNNTSPTSIIVSDWETASFISSLSNRPSATGFIIWRPQLPQAVVEHLINLNLAIKERNETILKSVLSQVPLTVDEARYLDYLRNKFGTPIEKYLIVTGNTLVPGVPYYAITCARKLDGGVVNWLSSLPFLRLVYRYDDTTLVFKFINMSRE